MSDKAKILFVDDERRILTSLKAIFKRQYEVHVAMSGPAALALFDEHEFDVIVSDQRMPEMLGHELLAQVKERSPNTMRLLLTGYSDLSAIVSSINEGEVFRFITKPWKVDEIRETIAEAVEISRETRVEKDASTTIDLLVPQGAGVLVLDDGDGVEQQVSGLGMAIPIYRATTLDDAVRLLQDEEIAVLLSDITIGGQDTTDFIKVLKQKYPLVMTTLLTDAEDAEVAIDLINQGQVFRYLAKPVRDAILKSGIEKGMQAYWRHQAAPQLVKRHKVEEVVNLRNPSIMNKLSDGLQNLRRRFSLRFAL